MADDYYENLKVSKVSGLKEVIGLGAFWRDIQFEYDVSGNLVYHGVHYLHNVGDSDSSWEIWKYTYGDDGITRIEGPLPGAWDDRATLDWG